MSTERYELNKQLAQMLKGGVIMDVAGLILLAEHLSNDEHVYFGTLPVTVRRNAYGRQLGSFHTDAEVKGIGEVPMTFIRAPYILRWQTIRFRCLPTWTTGLWQYSTAHRSGCPSIRNWMRITGSTKDYWN